MTRTGTTGLTRSLLGPATALAAGTGLACAVVAAFSGGGRGAASAAAATALVLTFLWAGQLPVAVAARGRGRLGTALLVTGYTLRVAAALLALVLFDATTLDRRVFGATVVLAALAWTAGATWVLARWRSVTIEPEMPERTGAEER